MQLSVFIITRGRVGIFRRCLRSVLEHLPKDSEVRVLINGTDSQTEKYLSTITDSRLIWRTIAKEPRTRCRNRAFDDCQGKIIYFLDDDVIVPPHALELALRRFDENPSLGILGGPNLTPTDSGFLGACLRVILLGLQHRVAPALQLGRATGQWGRTSPHSPPPLWRFGSAVCARRQV